MDMRLEQVHPAVVHLPIALLPLAVGADLLGTVTENEALHTFGRGAIAAAAVGALASAVTGLIAGEEVNVEGPSRDRLMTHRNLNAVATLVASSMALWRAENDRPNSLYFAAGLAGISVLTYTAYLGGKLVYETGVGVGPAEGVYRPDAPTLQAGQTGEFFKTAASDLAHGVQHMAEELQEGYFVPAIAGKRSEPS